MKTQTKVLDKLEDAPVIGSIAKVIKANMGILIGFVVLLVFLSIFAENFLS